ncbi:MULTISPECIES: hypothetical protein [Enterobacterales]|uniref:hypothetical protein n=1 Tax=Enterobacterales TaxID=91347 RepID=UPI000847FC72|nr:MULTISPECIES: hypothetical protein [Enterobacterales]WOO50860.1 hypothetical protein R2S03_06770 [Hafnia alvei]ODQ04974.1 hypothetical protein BGK50_19305 [Shigella sp. FC130]OEI92955.1 hypothetical protein BHE86_18320 [Shigella sp. FC1655]WOO50867.1 hypothetical protein R2S03_06820 [Hafnia alvei]WPF05332.1 hypothetical protein SB028_05620 [Proteus vulgaris]
MKAKPKWMIIFVLLFLLFTATIEDIPEELRKYIVVSDSLDFTKDRLLDNNKISDYFTRMYSE